MAATIQDMRECLMETLRDLRKPNNPIDVERAKAVAQVAQVIVESAKVEVAYINATGARGSGFIEDQSRDVRPALTGSGVVEETPAGRRHLMGG